VHCLAEMPVSGGVGSAHVRLLQPMPWRDRGSLRWAASSHANLGEWKGFRGVFVYQPWHKKTCFAASMTIFFTQARLLITFCRDSLANVH
jgi:hypothetical protein